MLRHRRSEEISRDWPIVNFIHHLMGTPLPHLLLNISGVVLTRDALAYPSLNIADPDAKILLSASTRQQATPGDLQMTLTLTSQYSRASSEHGDQALPSPEPDPQQPASRSCPCWRKVAKWDGQRTKRRDPSTRKDIDIDMG